MSKRIIATRKRLGGFDNIQGILKVKGIGKTTFEKIKPFIVVNNE